METLAGTADEARAHIARETDIRKKVIADAGIRLNDTTVGDRPAGEAVAVERPR